MYECAPQEDTLLLVKIKRITNVYLGKAIFY